MIVCAITVCYDIGLMKRRGHQINIQIKRGLKFPFARRWLTAICRTVLDEEGAILPVEIECILTDDPTMQRLNMQFRNIDEPTDVLSFAFKDISIDAQAASFPAVPDSPEILGQIIVSFPMAVKQAATHGHGVDQELMLLVVHGMLHLLGYDHQVPADERKMKQREKHILKVLGERSRAV
jgi:probable rRNA maturation factor